MYNLLKSTTIAAGVLCVPVVDGFGAAPKGRANPVFGQRLQMPTFSQTQLFATDDSAVGVDAEVERLRSMAAKLRAEAAALEAEQAQEIADATERAFQKFDTNQDGEISLDELKQGLEKVLKTEMDDDRVKKLMAEFDASGDGALQLDEFVTVDKFRGRLEGLIRDEKAAAREAAKQAKLESEAAALAEARLELLNESEPSTSDKLISILPYLFPLLDGLAFGRFLLADAGNEGNPFVVGLALIFQLYRSIPFSGFIAFFALSFLSSNFGLNRLIRFNMQQAIFLDIALFVPGFIASIYTLVLSAAGFQVPEIVTQVGNDAVFITLIAAIAYSVASSAFGVTPDKIPFLSDYVNQRMPTLDMFDESGRFIPQRPEDKKDEDDK